MIDQRTNMSQFDDARLTRANAFVYHGSIAVERSLDSAFCKAEAYLRGDSIMNRTLDDLENGTTRYAIRKNADDDDHFDPRTNIVEWDPHSALRTTDGGRQSPALGLGHELVHADEDGRTRARLASTGSRAYDNAEERRVIRGAEAHAAKTLGEGQRYDHAGSAYWVASPVLVA